MKRSYVASAAIILSLVMLLLAPSDISAKSGSIGMAHRRSGFHSHRHDGLRKPPLYGGYATTAPYDGPDFIGQGPFQTFVTPPEPRYSLICKRSQATVPSEDGGTRQILVTRCYVDQKGLQ
jgi:hypothetical protein